MKFIKNTRGAISIFLALIILPVYTCAGLIVDGTRISAARTAVSGAGDLAMNAALSEYDDVLFDVYGLFAMSETTEELQENVSRYFTNTINNEGILASSDSYTRNFINSIGSLFSTDEVSFDNIVDTKVEKFELVEVSNSALANPTVLERQIVEYMKYRGPVNLAKGLMTKIGCISETSKQTKVVEAKVDYEKKLDSVQECCESAYLAINAYNHSVGISKYTGDYLTKMTDDLTLAKSYIKEMTEYIIAAKSSSYVVSALSKDSELERAVEDRIDELEGDDKNIQALTLIKNDLKPVVEFEVNADGNYITKATEYSNSVRNYFGDGAGGTLESQQQYALDVKQNYNTFKKIYTYISMYNTYYNKLTSDEKALYSKERNAYNLVKAQAETIVSTVVNLPEQWKSEVNTKGSKASELLYEWYSPIYAYTIMLQDAIDALDKVLDKVDELDSARQKWNDKLEELSDSEIKSSLESDYNNSAKNMDETAVRKLKEVLTNNKAHFTAIKGKLDSVKFYGENICISNGASTNYYYRFSSIPAVEINASNSLSSWAQAVMDENYVNVDVTTGISPDSHTKITGDGENQGFYKYLKNVCAAENGETSEEKDEYKEKRKKLADDGAKIPETDTTGMTTGSYVTESGLTSDISAAIDALASGTDAGAKSFNVTKIDTSDDDDDAMADDGKDNLTKGSNMLEQLGDVAANARDSVYLEEYFTEMFSCYTSGSGNESNRSLSDHDMSTNKFYKSEVEYILYGKDTVEENLNTAKASVYGVRFALNSIYALTSSETRAQALAAATAIAGWTGFGIPIVQTVILLAWSMAESIVDLNMLCSGEAVVLYKTWGTWMLGIGGVKQAGKEMASLVIDDVFSEIENVANDSIDSINGTVTEYVNKTTDGLVESIQGSIMTSIETLLVQIIGESNYNLSENDIGVRVDNMLDTLVAEASSDSASDEATKMAIEAIKTVTILDTVSGNWVTIRDYLVKNAYSAYNDAKNGAITSVSNKVSEILTSVTGPIKEKILGTVSEVGERLKTKVSTIVSEGGSQVKEKVTSAIDDYLGDIGGTTGGVGTAAASGFALSYKEYMKMFVLMSLTTNETAMLSRCAELIQVNRSQSNSAFNITKAFTMVEVNATVSIGTTFFDVPVSTVDASGNQTINLDFDNLGSGRQTIKYVGILGY